ncbi:MAG: hypothetical protein RMK20_02000 [Verrucomicrobiales bacterium]|nr:hypothetical protein [Verrucomicrobiales bacterium]
MKTAYEIALEKMGLKGPAPRLTPEQKKQLAELDAQYAARIAECELKYRQQIEAAAGRGDFDETERLEEALVNERKKLKAELEEKKDAIWKAAGGK